MKRVLFSILAILIVVQLSACSAQNNTATEMYGGSTRAPDLSMKSGGTSHAPQAAPAANANSARDRDEEGSSASGGQSAFDPDPAHKIIFSAGLSIESLEFDASMGALDRLVADFGGYIESSFVTGGAHPVADGHAYRTEARHASLALRIPSKRFGEFLSRGGEIGSVTGSSTNSEDVTDVYFDSESRLKSLRVKEERLLAIFRKTEQLTDVIQLEQELSDTRYSIEKLTGELRKYDSLIAYSKVSVDIQEVKELSPEPATALGDRIALRFASSAVSAKGFLESMVVWLLGDSIQILSFLLVAAAAIMLGRYLFRRRAKRGALSSKLSQVSVSPAERPREGEGQPPEENK